MNTVPPNCILGEMISMIKRAFLFAGFFLTGWVSRCQSLVLPPAMLHSLPVVMANDGPDIWASLSQPAGLAGHDRWQAGVLGEQRFGLAALTDYLCGVIMPAGKGSFALQWRMQGRALFNWQQACLAYGRPLGNTVDVGVGFRYTRTRISEYGRAGVADAMLGLLFRLSGKVNSDIYVSYVPPGSANVALIRSVYRLGMSYRVTEEAAFGCVMLAVNSMKPDLLTAVDYCIKKYLRLRFSFSALRGSWGLSMAWNKGGCRVDAFTSHHMRLGLSPGVGIVYQGKPTNGE